MSPDTLESRFAALVQRVNDLVESVAERFKHSDEAVERRFVALDSDIRALSPLVRDVDRIAATQERFRESQQALQAQVEALHARMDKREEQEAADRKAREEEARSGRRQLYVGMALVLASSFGAFLVQILHVAPH